MKRFSIIAIVIHFLKYFFNSLYIYIYMVSRMEFFIVVVKFNTPNIDCFIFLNVFVVFFLKIINLNNAEMNV